MYKAYLEKTSHEVDIQHFYNIYDNGKHCLMCRVYMKDIDFVDAVPASMIEIRNVIGEF